LWKIIYSHRGCYKDRVIYIPTASKKEIHTLLKQESIDLHSLEVQIKPVMEVGGIPIKKITKTQIALALPIYFPEHHYLSQLRTLKR
jgi:hypothetical protein